MPDFNKGDFTQQGVAGHVNANLRLNEKRLVNIDLTSDEEAEGSTITGTVTDLLNDKVYNIGSGGGGGEDGTFDATLLPETSYNITQQEQGVSNSYYLKLELSILYGGNKINVLFNGTKYECDVKRVGGGIELGAPLNNGSYDYSTYPFNVVLTSKSGTYIRVEHSGDYTVGLAYPIEAFHVTVTTDVENAYLGYILTVMGNPINAVMPLENTTYIIEGVGGLALLTPMDSKYQPIIPTNLVNCEWVSGESMLMVTGDNASFTVHQ